MDQERRPPLTPCEYVGLVTDNRANVRLALPVGVDGSLGVNVAVLLKMMSLGGILSLDVGWDDDRSRNQQVQIVSVNADGSSVASSASSQEKQYDADSSPEMLLLKEASWADVRVVLNRQALQSDIAGRGELRNAQTWAGQLDLVIKSSLLGVSKKFLLTEYTRGQLGVIAFFHSSALLELVPNYPGEPLGNRLMHLLMILTFERYFLSILALVGKKDFIRTDNFVPLFGFEGERVLRLWLMMKRNELVGVMTDES